MRNSLAPPPPGTISQSHSENEMNKFFDDNENLTHSQPSTPKSATIESASAPILLLKGHDPSPLHLNGVVEVQKYFASLEETFVAAHIPMPSSPSASTSSLSVSTSSSSSVASLNGRYLPPRREELPANKSSAKISIWNLLKESVGKDLSKVALPVVLNEPTSFLQRSVEDLEYSELLDKAADAADPSLRLVYVAAFAASGYNSTVRLSKAFNPVLGETYELVSPEKGLRVVSEQVSHHPPVSAIHAEARKYIFWTSLHPKNKFWGKSLEVFPIGKLKLKLLKTNEFITWSKVATCVHSLIIGTPWVDHYGTMEIVNHTTGGKCVLNFVKHPDAGWFSSEGSFWLQGTVFSEDGHPTYKLHGKWNESISACSLTVDPSMKAQKGSKIKITDMKEGPSFLVWKVNPSPPVSAQQYNFTYFTMILNELTEWLRPYLPPTDSRLRPDQRALENGDLDTAGKEKTRIEEKQRAARKKRGEKDGRDPWEPRWFKLDSKGKDIIEGEWTYKGGYWESRNTGKFDDCADLF